MARRDLGAIPTTSRNYRFRCATNSPLSTPLCRRLQEAFDEIAAESAGRVRIDLFPSNQLGSDGSSFFQVREGAIEFALVAGSLMASTVPDAGLSALPFLFDSDAEAFAAVDGSMGAVVRKSLEPVGVSVLAEAFLVGFHQLTSSSRPIVTPADLKSFRLRVPDSSLYVDAFLDLGAAPTPISFGETYQSLQSHLLDGQTSAIGTLVAARFYEVQKYCAITDHIWENLWLLASSRIWLTLPSAHRDLINRHLTRASVLQREDMQAFNVSARQELVAKGMEFVSSDRRHMKHKLQASTFYERIEQKLSERGKAALRKQMGRSRS